MNFSLKMRVGVNPRRHDDDRKAWAVLDWAKKPGEDTVDCLIVFLDGGTASLKGVPLDEFASWSEVEFTASFEIPKSTDEG